MSPGRKVGRVGPPAPAELQPVKGSDIPMKYLNSAIFIFGILSFVSLIGFYLALHDIWHDYASPEVWARAGQVPPDWYSSVNGCPVEWGMMQVGLVIILSFHILLFVRMIKTARSRPMNSTCESRSSSFDGSHQDSPRDPLEPRKGNL